MYSLSFAVRVLTRSAVAFLLLGCFLLPAQSQAKPIKIGVMFPYTGSMAAMGIPERDAVKLAFDEVHNKVAGRKIELLYEDSEARPDVGLAKIKALVERDHVDLLVSELMSNVGAAIAPYITQHKIPWISTVALAALTRKMASPYIFRFVPSAYQHGMVAADWAKQHGWKKAYFIGWNAPPGKEVFQAVQKIFGKKNIVAAMFPNIGTPDYAPYLSRMDPSKADGVFVGVWGSDAIRITRQFAAYGLKGKLPFFGVAAFTTEPVLAHMPPQAAGIMSGYTYCGTLDTPQNKRFIAEYRSHFKGTPGSYEYMGYMAAKFVIKALQDVKGNVENRPAFLAALRKARIKGPMGWASFDSHQGMVGDFYILKVVDHNGHLENQCVERVPQVKDPYGMFP